MSLARWGMALVLLLVAGCGSVTSRSSPTETLEMSLERSDYRRLGYVRGEDCVPRVLVFLRPYSPDPARALVAATAEAPEANLLLNRHVTLKERAYVPGIYHEVCLVVEGTAVELYDGLHSARDGS